MAAKYGAPVYRIHPPNTATLPHWPYKKNKFFILVLVLLTRSVHSTGELQTSIFDHLKHV
jgi:hypothetical protein